MDTIAEIVDVLRKRAGDQHKAYPAGCTFHFEEFVPEPEQSYRFFKLVNTLQEGLAASYRPRR
eukprot:8308494-Lingulodinium_polyedra.AAC.1